MLRKNSESLQNKLDLQTSLSINLQSFLKRDFDNFHVSKQEQAVITKSLEELVSTMPPAGHFTYHDLQEGFCPDYKAKVDDFIEKLLKFPDFKQFIERYEKTALEFAALSGYGVESIQTSMLECVRDEIYNIVGGEVLYAIEDYKNLELDKEEPKDPIGKIEYFSGRGSSYIANFYTSESYIEALKDAINSYGVVGGVKGTTISKDPTIRKAIADLLYDAFGEENPRRLENYQEQSRGMGQEQETLPELEDEELEV